MSDPLPYPKPRRVWVEDGYVFTEGQDGAILKMDPEVAIEFGRLLDRVGTDTFIDAVMRKATNNGELNVYAPVPVTSPVSSERHNIV